MLVMNKKAISSVLFLITFILLIKVVLYSLMVLALALLWLIDKKEVVKLTLFETSIYFLISIFTLYFIRITTSLYIQWGKEKVIHYPLLKKIGSILIILSFLDLMRYMIKKLSPTLEPSTGILNKSWEGLDQFKIIYFEWKPIIIIVGNYFEIRPTGFFALVSGILLLQVYRKSKEFSDG